MKRNAAGLLLMIAFVVPTFAGCLGSDGSQPASVVDPVDPPVSKELSYLAPGTPLSLELDVPVFWTGPRIASAATLLLPEHRCTAQLQDPCLYYPLEVPEGATEVRAALDRPDHRDVFWLSMQDPSGEWTPRAAGMFSMEVRVANPEPGSWILRVEPIDVKDATFRMRVHAVGAVDDQRPEGAWLPNLRPVPAFDFRFESPVGATQDLVPMVPAAVPAGVAPSSCHAEEWALNGYTERCLRFSFGFGNDGHGPFDVLVGDPPPGSLTAPATQRVHASDGSHEDRSAGTATVHAGHQHHHLDGIYEIEMLRVEDGQLVAATAAAKLGACTLDYLLMNWTSWDQDPQWSSESNCASLIPGVGTANPFVKRISMARGWADVYIWDLADNYVDMTDQPDGEYVMRATIDLSDHFLETNEDDNVGYTHLLVHGSGVEVLERGYGQDPWDPEKQVIEQPWVS